MNKVSSILKILGLVVLGIFVVLFLYAKMSDNSAVDRIEKIEEKVTFDNIKQASLDVTYSSRNKFMKDGPQSLEESIAKMQVVLKAWPETLSKSDPCYVALNREIIRWLDLIEGLDNRAYSDNRDYSHECRESINYEYNPARLVAVWNNI